VSHPDNRGYVQSLRDAGIKIPGDEGYQSNAEKEAQAMQEAQQTTLVEKVVSMASELGEMRGELRNPPAKEADPTETAASLAAIQTLQEITTKAVDSAERRAEVASRGQDLPTMMKVLSELAERMKPDPTVLSAALSRSAELEKALLQMQQGLIERAEREAAFYREAALKPGASAAAAPSAAGPVDLVGEFRKAKELVELFSPPAATAPRESSAFLERNLPAILQAAQNIIGRIGETVHNAAVAKTGQGIPVAPAPIAAAPQSPGSPVSTDPDVAYALSRNVPPEVIDELKRITEPLCSHFTGTPDTNGYSFANWIVTGGTAAMENEKGRGQYQLMKAAGADALLQLLQAWRPIWSRIGGFPPQRIQQFIAEFLDYDDWLARQQEPEPPGPAPSLRVA
jgi:hypothetical protein